MLRRAVAVAEMVVVRIGMCFRRTFGRLFLALTAFEAGCLSDGRSLVTGSFRISRPSPMQLCGAGGVGRRAETEESRRMGLVN